MSLPFPSPLVLVLVPPHFLGFCSTCRNLFLVAFMMESATKIYMQIYIYHIFFTCTPLKEHDPCYQTEGGHSMTPPARVPTQAQHARYTPSPPHATASLRRSSASVGQGGILGLTRLSLTTPPPFPAPHTTTHSLFDERTPSRVSWGLDVLVIVAQRSLLSLLCVSVAELSLSQYVPHLFRITTYLPAWCFPRR